jgi:hypothetical protein
MLQILPVWTDLLGVVHYHLPKQLLGLREGEKLIISPYLVYVPLHHLRKGQLAMQGHVCCFPQDVPSFVSKLPRLPKDANLIRVIRNYRDNSDDSGETKVKHFLIRRPQVEDALLWLKQFSKAFVDVELDFTNFDWMCGLQEMQLPGISHTQDLSDDEYLFNRGNNDQGPSPEQNAHYKNDEIILGGYKIQHPIEIDDTNKNLSARFTKAIETARLGESNNELSVNGTIMDWPHVQTEAVREYDDENLFSKAFPWLFPGGTGDFNQFRDRNIDINDWVHILLRYEDGRFARDKMWTFYALNYRERLKNKARGSFFVNNFNTSDIRDVEDIVSQVSKGDMTWIDKISYFNGTLRATPGYWRSKRVEVHSWINHHIQAGNGPPTFFITLSCAEYWWKDIERLINNRFIVANLQPPFNESNKQTNRVRIINDYTLVVQEFFQTRVSIWLSTVGTHVFKIKHHWCRFEFAPSRGQVHAHLLAIADFGSFFSHIHKKVPVEKRADVLALWAGEQLGLRNSFISEQCEDTTMDSPIHPCASSYTDILDGDADIDSLLAKCQQHTCSDYCLRQRKLLNSSEKTESRKRRVCKFGCGVEESAFKCNTPGFPFKSSNTVCRDIRGYSRIDLRRVQNRRTLQSSMHALQSWRANCDVQVLLYDTDPTNPDALELAKVVDYIVGYTCKNTESMTEERQRLKSFVLSIADECTDVSEISLAIRVMNTAMRNKLISKQEATVLLAGLELCICSEHIETVNLSGSYRLDTGSYSNRFYSSYANRHEIYAQMTMDEFFNHSKNNGNKKYVPNYVGGKMHPIWPPTEEFARAMLAVHKPWRGKFTYETNDLIPSFLQLFFANKCPRKLHLLITREIHRHESGAVFREESKPAKAYDYSDFTEKDFDESNRDLVALVSTLPGDAAGREDEHMFDYGKLFDWHTPRVPLTVLQNEEIDSWLENNVAYKRDCIDAPKLLKLPTRYDGSFYELQSSTTDQADILAYILDFIKSSFELENETTPVPIRMTITGVAGSGKSTLIHTLTTALRKMFDSNDSVIVCAPTGNAASNVHGTTCHYATKIGKIQPLIQHIPAKTLIELKKVFNDVLCLIVDERSLLSSTVIGRMEYNCRHAVNNGYNKDLSWGNIPIVLLIGDDYQLPPIEPGAFQIFNGTRNKHIDILLGEKVLEDLGNTTMTLSTSKRVLPGQKAFKDILQRLRAESNDVSHV